MKTLSSQWVKYRTIAYLRGRGLIFGCGPDTPLPREAKDTGKYAINCDTRRHPAIEVCDPDLSMFAAGQADFVFVGTGFELAKDKEILIQLIEKLKVGGHLILHTTGDIAGFMPIVRLCGRWQAKDSYDRAEQRVAIFKRLTNRPGEIVERVPEPGPRACIARYGAIGDLVMVTPLIRKLAEDGYKVTLNITPYALDVVKNNPYVSNILVQERDAIPNPELGQYWDEWRGDYDRYINLSESIEGNLLKIESRKDFYTPQSWRTTQCNLNYYDRTMALGGYPEVVGTRGELFFDRTERRDAAHFKSKLPGRMLVMWALNGSSHHKAYPLMEDLLREWLPTHPEVMVLTVGDANAQALEFEHPQVWPMAGRMPLRQVLALVPVMDCVVGPETAITNAAACYDVEKIVFLSHSTRENLTRYWTNCHALEPDTAIAPCYPCHQLHYTKDTCPLVEIYNESVTLAMPACTMGVSAARTSEALTNAYNSWKTRQMLQ
jgi:ADP-heptose:LPS heptosyltransferase